MLRITLLAAGFVIGPAGASVREIMRRTGAEIKSWTEATGGDRPKRPARIFLVGVSLGFRSPAGERVLSECCVCWCVAVYP